MYLLNLPYSISPGLSVPLSSSPIPGYTDILHEYSVFGTYLPSFLPACSTYVPLYPFHKGRIIYRLRERSNNEVFDLACKATCTHRKFPSLDIELDSPFLSFIPRLAGSHAFRTLDRRILGIVTQARTGHGYFGEYYQTQNIQEPADCPCGAGLQTCEHIVFECRTHEEYGDIIDKGAPDHQLAMHFGTKKGINTLAEFIRKTKAFQKTQAVETP